MSDSAAGSGETESVAEPLWPGTTIGEAGGALEVRFGIGSMDFMVEGAATFPFRGVRDLDWGARARAGSAVDRGAAVFFGLEFRGRFDWRG